jgi:DNA-binding LytR/AlgR family response regulator
MPIKIGICDDRAEDIGRLKEALYSYNPSFQIIEYTDGDQLLEDCEEKKYPFDLLFLDIYMPLINGIELAGKIRSLMNDVKIIFVSSSKDHYSDAYDVFAFHYLIKPIDSNKLNYVLDHALINIRKERSCQIQFSYKGANYRLLCMDILYVESRDKLILFHTLEGAVLKCYAKLTDIMDQLPRESFVRCHQSYAVNMLHIKEMTDSSLRIDDMNISISRKYRKESKDKYYEYLFTHMNT